jgi:hypothetical protein
MFGTSTRILTINDSRSSLKTDQDITGTFSMKIVKYGFTEDPETKKKTFNFEAVEDEIEINEAPRNNFVIYDIFPYGDEMVLKYTSEDSDGKFYLTQLEKNLGDEVPSLIFNSENPTFQSLVNAEDGFLTMTDND